MSRRSAPLQALTSAARSSVCICAGWPCRCACRWIISDSHPALRLHPPAVHRRCARRLQSGGSTMIPEAQKQQMAEAVAHIRETMAAAARAAGRDPAQIKLCAACKTRTVEEVPAAPNCRSTSLARTMCRSWLRKPMPVRTTASRGILSAICRPTRSTRSWAAPPDPKRGQHAAAGQDRHRCRPSGASAGHPWEINIGGETSKSGVDADSLFPAGGRCRQRESAAARADGDSACRCR